MAQAFLAAEDDRFFEHPGVDYQGLVRAALIVMITGEKSQGGSTITMQLARNLFLTRKQHYRRKLQEIYLSLRIERELDKQEILTLYLNKIFLGQRAYGVGAAAQVYFGKEIGDLSLAEVAVIAGLPKAPSNLNPVSNPDAARDRRSYVLRRMLELDYIDESTYQTTMDAPVESRLHGPRVDCRAPYMSEMVREHLLYNLQLPNIFTAGYKVTTTLDCDLHELGPVHGQHLRHAGGGGG